MALPAVTLLQQASFVISTRPSVAIVTAGWQLAMQMGNLMTVTSVTPGVQLEATWLRTRSLLGGTATAVWTGSAPTGLGAFAGSGTWTTTCRRKPDSLPAEQWRQKLESHWTEQQRSAAGQQLAALLEAPANFNDHVGGYLQVSYTGLP